MPGLMCCAPCRHPSPGPELPNSRPVGSSKENASGLLQPSNIPDSIRSVNTAASGEEFQEIRKIFASSEIVDAREVSQSSVSDDHHRHSGRKKTHQRGSSGRLHDVLRKRLSLDSGISTRALRRKSKSTLSEEEIVRRREMKRALHRRIQDDILEDRRASEGGYDTDAEVILTPTITKSRSEGMLMINAKRLSSALKRLESEPSLSGARYDKEIELFSGFKETSFDIHAPNTPALVLGDKTDNANHQGVFVASTVTVRKTPIWEAFRNEKYAKRDSEEPRKTLSESPLQRSSTVVRVLQPTEPSLRQEKPIDDFDWPESPPPPDLRPLRLPSISASSQHNWHLSRNESHHDLKARDHGTPCDLVHDSCVLNGDFVKATEPLRRGTPGLLGLPSPGISTPSRFEDKARACPGHIPLPEPHCNLQVEENEFGGVDGSQEGYFGRKEREAPGVQSSPLKAQNGQRYSRHNEEKLKLRSKASRPLFTSFVSHQRPSSSGKDSTSLIGPSRHLRQSSSSGFVSAKVPAAWGSVLHDNASSVYPSQPGSLLPSPSSSVMRVQSPLLERLFCYENTGSRDVQSEIGNGSVTEAASISEFPHTTNRTHAKRRTIDTTSFQSSTDSFRAQEIAAAELRFIAKPKAFTTPKTSRFVEELEELKSASSIGRAHCADDRHARKTSLASIGGLAKWYKTGKREGYGYEFVPVHGDSALDISEHESRGDAANDRDNISSIHPIFDPSNLSVENLQKRRRSKGIRARPPLLSFPATNFEEHAHNGGHRRIVHSDSNNTSGQARKAMGRASPSSSTDSWTRFPSHTRVERSFSPAGEADRVEARDFAPHYVVATAAGSSSLRRSSVLNKKKKSRSMTFGRHIIKTWSRLHKSRSNDLKGYRKKFYSSAPMLEYPELEIIPPIPPSPEEPGRFITFRGPGSIASQESIIHTVLRQNMAERSANVWSKIYEDCIQHPRDTEDASVAETSSSPPQATTSQHEGTRDASHEPIPRVSADMRDSSFGFQRSLRIQESLAREKALQVAEQAWGPITGG